MNILCRTFSQVQPRRRYSTTRIGIGIPKAQSSIQPILPFSLFSSIQPILHFLLFSITFLHFLRTWHTASFFLISIGWTRAGSTSVLITKCVSLGLRFTFPVIHSLYFNYRARLEFFIVMFSSILYYVIFTWCKVGIGVITAIRKWLHLTCGYIWPYFRLQTGLRTPYKRVQNLRIPFSEAFEPKQWTHSFLPCHHPPYNFEDIFNEGQIWPDSAPVCPCFESPF